MYKISTAFSLLLFGFTNILNAQKSISEATIQYDFLGYCIFRWKWATIPVKLSHPKTFSYLPPDNEINFMVNFK